MISLVLRAAALRDLILPVCWMPCLIWNLIFPYMIGVSAGISNGYSYASGQKDAIGSLPSIIITIKRYCSYRNLLTNRSMFGLDFMFSRCPNELLPYDYNALAVILG